MPLTMYAAPMTVTSVLMSFSESEIAAAMEDGDRQHHHGRELRRKRRPLCTASVSERQPNLLVRRSATSRENCDFGDVTVLLYDSPVSGNCYKVRLLLAHLDIPYDRRTVDVVDRSDRPGILGGLNSSTGICCGPSQ